jgi:FixJ family two-component response regulator
MTKEERQIIIRAVRSQSKKSYDLIASDLEISKPTLLRSRERWSAHAVGS